MVVAIVKEEETESDLFQKAQDHPEGLIADLPPEEAESKFFLRKIAQMANTNLEIEMTQGHPKGRGLILILANLQCKLKSTDPKAEMIDQYLQSEVTDLNQNNLTRGLPEADPLMPQETGPENLDPDVTLKMLLGTDRGKDLYQVSLSINIRNLVTKSLPIRCTGTFPKTRSTVRKQMRQR